MKTSNGFNWFTRKEMHDEVSKETWKLLATRKGRLTIRTAPPGAARRNKATLVNMMS